MRAQLKGGVALAGAQVIDLAEWRNGRKPKHDPKPAFKPTDRPGMDFNEMSHGLAAAAKYVRDGRMGARDIAKLLEGLSVNAHAACRVGHDLEFRIMAAERLLKPIFGNLGGKALTKAIWEASKRAGVEARRKARKAEREERRKR